jgi:hypothetical protein
MKENHDLRSRRRSSNFFGKFPALVVFIYLGLLAIPLLAAIDLFTDFPPGDQDWKTYLTYWPPTMLLCALVGLLADGLGRFLSRHDMPNEVQPSDMGRNK